MSFQKISFGVCLMLVLATPCEFAQAQVLTSPPASGTATSNVPSSPVRQDTTNGYSLAFLDADVRRVVDAILGSMLGADYSIDPEVSGNVTLRTTRPVTGEALVPLLERALQSVDAVILKQGKGYRVISRKSARTQAPVALQSDMPGSNISGYSSQIVTLKYASAKEMARLLEQFLGKEIVGGSNAALNQIIIAGTGGEREAARALIDRFDVDSLANMAYEVYRLQNVDPDSLIGELKSIFQPPYDIIGSRVRIISLPRLRSVMIISNGRADIERVAPWITRLDVGVSGKRKLYNYPIQNGRARDIATALQQVLGQSSAPSVSQPSGQHSVGQGMASGFEGSQSAGELRDSAGDLPAAGDLSAQIPTISAPGGGIRIVPNEQNNSLLIYADGEEYELIHEALESLDQPVAQVLIEATLAEVTLNNDLRYGVDFKTISGDATITNVSNGSGSPASSFPGFSLNVLGNSTQMILNSLQSKTDVKVLSAPKLMVLNNQTAMLQVGDQVPIITQLSQSVAAPGAPVVNSVDLRDTGVILKVTPRVNDNGAVTLDISQEVSDVAETTTSGINSPTIQQRRLASTVSTRSGEMIALGGLIRDRTIKGRTGIPLVSQLPVIGAAFGRKTVTGNRTELIILLTPTVIRSSEGARQIVDQLIDRLDKARPLVDRALERQIGGKFQQIPSPISH